MKVFLHDERLQSNKKNDLDTFFNDVCDEFLSLEDVAIVEMLF
jgi:hypothetical protein